MFPILYKFFALHKYVAIPDLGTFTLSRKAAFLNDSTATYSAPESYVNFHSGAVTADKKLYSFIAAEKAVEEEVAVKELHDFSFNLKQKVKSDGKVVLPGMGTLVINAAGALAFQSANELAGYSLQLGNNNTDRKNNSDVNTTAQQNDIEQEDDVETAGRKDYWWIFAITLAIAAIAAIVYYYIKNGTLPLGA